MNELTGRTALVTGAGSGIGEAIALGLAKHGANLCLVGRRLEPLERVAERVREWSVRAFCYPTDLTQDGDLQHFVGHLSKDVDDVDVLVHNAGVIIQGPLETLPLGAFDEQMRLNVRAPFVLTQALLPRLRRRQGQVVFINSSIVRAARANTGVYAATKCALKALADSLREEVNTQGIRVISVYPGRTATATQARIHEVEKREYRPERLLEPETVARAVTDALLMPRDAEVTDVYIRPFQKPT